MNQVPGPGFSSPTDPRESSGVPSAPAPGSIAQPGNSYPPHWRPAPAPAPSPPPGRPAQRGRRGLGMFGITLLVILSFLLGLTTGIIWADDTLGLRTSAPAPDRSLAPSVGGNTDVGQVATAVMDSTVYLECFTGPNGGSGTGIVYTADGVIVTNAHVIMPDGELAEDIEVVLPDGQRKVADVVGYSTDYDIAVITVNADGLTPLPLADSGSVAVGDRVVAVGAPLGLTGTVTTGIISAVERPVRSGGRGPQSFMNALQTDAAINPGNSGGPLVDMGGQMVGLNSAIAQPVTTTQEALGSIGLGFAIPATQVKYTAEEILSKGYATYPVMGIMVDMTDRRPGAAILSGDDTPGIVAGGPADRAGLREGDRIMKVNDRQISSVTQFIVYLRSLTPGEHVSLVVERGGSQFESELTLEEHRAD
ncbi:MAG: trypsin-like peptidase domain-containing protein [Bowdeniella nasicola]|nr:trypsin-like peptidase domain-containing protein [Bowdeniella nasicola]